MIIQKPISPNEWLYKDISANERWFTNEICRPDNSEPWLQCTGSERKKWEESHSQPEPEQEPNDTEAE